MTSFITGITRGAAQLPIQQEDSFIRDFFGLTQQEFLRASPQTLRTQLNVRQGAPFDPQTGLPLRPARTLQEAANFEFAQNLFVNRLAQANQARAAAAIQAQIGLVERGGPGSLQQLLSPAFTTLANILGTTTFQPFDFTAGVVSPQVGGFRPRARGGDRQIFGGISDPFGGRSIQEFAQQFGGGPGLPQQFAEEFRQRELQRFAPGAAAGRFGPGAVTGTLQDQLVQQFDRAGVPPGGQPFGAAPGAEDIFQFGTAGQEFAESLFAGSPFAFPEFGLLGIPGAQDFDFQGLLPGGPLAPPEQELGPGFQEPLGAFEPSPPPSQVEFDFPAFGDIEQFLSRALGI